MRCPTCDAENPADAAFCMNCGGTLALFCPRCDTQLPAGASFCFKCGARLVQPAPPPGPAPATEREQRLHRLVPREFAERLLSTRGQVGRERRVVTILFSDVKGSTAMAEDLDPEDVMEIMDGAFDVLIEPVYRYEGTLARLMGDAVLAFFGAPIAHEDDPERACRAALDILEGAQAYAGCLERERGISAFNVRVGINTGLVVVGEVGSDLRVEYTAMGDAINLAQRMESAAQPGTVLISEATHKLVAPLFATESLGPIAVKGKAEPVPVYRVLATRAARGKMRGIAGLESPLVGRQAEFGVGGIVTVVGEAGIGKSRLVAELRSGATHLTWLEGRCLSYGSSIAYLLWLDILRGLLGVSPEDPPLEVRDALEEAVRSLCPDRLDNDFDAVKDKVYPYLGRLLSLPLEEEVEAALADLEGREIKARTFQAVEAILESVAADGPLVLLCEDLHWADSTSLELLESLLPLAERLPLLFLCVFRPERDRRVWRLRETIAGQHQRLHTAISLEALSADEGETLVDNLLQAEGLPDDLKARILSHAEGNPFYLEEILRSLLDEGAIEQDVETGRWRAAREVSEITIPDTLLGVLVARIDRLQEETRRVLQMAAVVGRLFLYRVLEAIAREQRDLDVRVQILQREEMIRERARLPELEYIFKHELTRDAAYNGLLKKERRVFHRQAAEALERLFPDRVEEQVGLLAHHWERSGDAERASEYLLRAGDQARLAYAHDEAIDYYQRSLAFLRQGDDVERAARTVMKLGLTYQNAFRFREACAAYDEGFGLWQRASEAEPVSALAPAPHALRQMWIEHPILDPGLFIDSFSLVVIRQLFSGLVEHTLDLGIVPDVATRWELLDGGTRYLFHLRDDVRWSDGLPVTAHDFEYAWKRVLDPATGSETANSLFDIRGARAFHEGTLSEPDAVGVRAQDDLTLSVELEAPTGYLLHLLSKVYPVPRHVVERGATWTEPGSIVCNGPFTLASWRHGEMLVLERNSLYHGRFAGNLERVEVSLGLPYSEWFTALEMYEADRADYFMLAPNAPREMDRVRQRHGSEYVSLSAAETYYLAFDVTCAPFEDPRVRRALALALDRKALADATMGGFLSPAAGGLVTPGIPGHSPGIAFPHEPQRATELLAAAGHPSGKGFPEVELVTNPALQGVCEHLEAQWQEYLGLEIRWRVVELSESYRIRAQESPPMFITGWAADYPDPDNFLHVALQSATAWGPEGYLELVERARRSTDQPERMNLYARAERLLAEDVPLLPLFYGRTDLLLKPWVKRYPVSALGDLFWKDVVIELH